MEFLAVLGHGARHGHIRGIDCTLGLTPSHCPSCCSIKHHNWHIQSSCAITGEGLLDGLKWIAQAVKLKQKQ